MSLESQVDQTVDDVSVPRVVVGQNVPTTNREPAAAAKRSSSLGDRVLADARVNPGSVRAMSTDMS